MKICGREYRLKFSKKQDGGAFWCDGANGNGNGEVIIGDYKDIRFKAEILIHEIFEAILVEDDNRYMSPGCDGENSRYMFMFDHRYMDSIGPKVLDALLTSGMFKLVKIK